jgi:hypothetical protein
MSSEQQPIHKISVTETKFQFANLLSCYYYYYTNLQKEDPMKRIDSPWSIDPPNASPMWWHLTLPCFIGEDGGITSCTWLCGFVCSNAHKQKNPTNKIPGRKTEEMDSVRKQKCKNQGSLTFQQMGTSTLQRDSWWWIWWMVNWYPPCENKWVSEWVDGVGFPIDTHRIKTNEWKDGWVPTNTQQVKTKWESSTLRLQMKDPPKPICTKCTRDEQRIPTLFNKGKPLVSEWLCTNGCATLRRA